MRELCGICQCLVGEAGRGDPTICFVGMAHSHVCGSGVRGSLGPPRR